MDVESGANLVHSFPTEVDFFGVFDISNNSTINQQETREQIKDIDVTDCPVLIHCKIADDENEILINIVNNEQIEETKYSVIAPNELYSQYVHIRLNGKIPFNCDAEEKSIEDAFLNIRKQVTSGSIGFNFPDSSVCILGNEYENNVICNKKNCVFDDFWEDFNGLSEIGGKKKKTQQNELEIININMLQRVTRDTEKINHAPLCILNKSMNL